MAAICDIGESRVQALERDGVMFKSARGEYLLRESITGYISYLQDSSRGRPSDEDNQDLREEKLKQEIRKLTRENDEQDLILVNRKEMIRAGQPIMMRLSAELDRVGEIAAESEPLDPKTVEDINLYFIPFKNELAALADKMLIAETQTTK